MILSRCLLLCLLYVAGGSVPAVWAGDLVLEGEAIQGGLMTGRTAPGTAIRVDDKAVRVGEDGLFVFGFGRDAPPRATVSALFPDGGRAVRRLDVRQRDYRIQRIDGLPSRMVTPSADELARIRAEGEKIAAARAGFSARTGFAAGFIWPAQGRISGVYGSQRILNGEARQPHLGIDIAAPAGTPVVAAAAGAVTLAEPDLYFTGGTVVIDHGHGLSTVYSHLSAVGVAVGQEVARGQLIGRIGSTGRSTGAHLDWRINWFQERLDPMLIAGPPPQ